MKDDGSVDSYKKEGKPWFAPLIPQFETDRTGLGCHGDGGDFIGTLGCCGITSGDMEAKDLISSLLSQKKELIFKVA